MHCVSDTNLIAHLVNGSGQRRTSQFVRCAHVFSEMLQIEYISELRIWPEKVDVFNFEYMLHEQKFKLELGT